ncbi:hypothetical protein H310_02624 [Aphanomyces invadans]|uniref:HSF-type DNA-binding domain-containing protein n=1 Tax=Aphanomyces invadans TaxID=157072 RepID=A0A024UKG1_9STRA|nr:hypothetical protein H310_02624 [Aphanomyces invadans]ETW06342.1 hypothetical protein H310_02624 [Aphanomyces invadans]RHY29337.1 hypothetical protein DYB32_005226 [Aphanomyces invadans]|eukprot:XP_008864417.1 hypothetical protein H310_02624 [Aphanomyces invadans]
MTPNESREYAGDTSKKNPTSKQHDVPKFLLQLFDILEAESSAVIKWADDGGSFQILDPVRATQEILPKYFSHNNFQSFQRQLNYFGFRKWTKTKTFICTFSHPYFQKNEPDKLHLIKRKSVPKRVRVNGHLVADKSPVLTKKRSDDSSSTSTSAASTPCVIRPYTVPGGTAQSPSTPNDDFSIKVMPADVLLFSQQAGTLPNLCKIRSSLMLRMEASVGPPAKLSPTSCSHGVVMKQDATKAGPVDSSEEDPVNLLLGIKQAAAPPSPSNATTHQSNHETHVPRTPSPATLQTKLAAAQDEIADLRACLHFQIQENERLRSQLQQQCTPPSRPMLT